MDAFDWFHVLTPIAIVVITTNLLANIALKPEYRSAQLKKYSLIGYSGVVKGWLIMKLGTLFTNVMLVTKICIIGWLILMPSLLLTAGCLVIRLLQDKSNFSTTSRKIMNFILLLIKSIGIIIFNLLRICATFFTRRPTHMNYNSSASHETFGGPHVFDKPPKDIFGGEHHSPQNDPFSPWSSK